MLKCDEANHVCDKAQHKDASLKEKVKLTIHLIFCSACRKYTVNNIKLTRIIKKSHIMCMDKKCKESIRLEVDKAIKETETN